jgi:type II secretory pathway pseudopilin PulG
MNLEKLFQRWNKSATNVWSARLQKFLPLPEGEGRGEGEARLMTTRRFTSRPAASLRAFTIIEIALCLGIIGFALVAIIGALPVGLNVQKLNREQTIIGSDASVWMDALRSGAQGYDDLTNHVLYITNQWATYDGDFSVISGGSGGTPVGSGSDWYSVTNSSVTGVALTNGAAIIGLLSTPVWTSVFPGHGPPGGRYQSNYVIAYVRAFSGAEVDKVPQNNPTILADAFIYRMIVENYPYAAVDTNAFCMNCPAASGLSPIQKAQRQYAEYAEMLLQTNTHDFRLRFRWPVLPSGQIPNYGEATFRQMATGEMLQTNYPGATQPLYFMQPSIYGQLTTTNATPMPQPW